MKTVIKDERGNLVAAVGTRDSRMYPVELDLRGQNPDRNSLLTIQEARNIAKELYVASDEAEEATRSYVKVVFPGSPSKYTYFDPSGTLVIGDEVMVAGNYQGSTAIAQVVALGKGDYDGPAKALMAKVVRL